MNYSYVAVFCGKNANINTETQELNYFYEIYHLRESDHDIFYIKNNLVTKNLGINSLKGTS